MRYSSVISVLILISLVIIGLSTSHVNGSQISLKSKLMRTQGGGHESGASSAASSAPSSVASSPSAAESSSCPPSSAEPSSASEYGGEPLPSEAEEDSSSSSSSSTGGGDSDNLDCQPGTYSMTGFQPCWDCPNNTYANIREIECTPCPANMNAPQGAASLTACVCNEGFTSQWATGGPCYPVDVIPEYEDCQPGTYSETGHPPCQQCPNNTYANIRATECTPCPANSSAPEGAASLTECVCDEGFWSPWATGGPCYADGEGPDNSTDSSSTGGEPLPPPPEGADECTSYETATECDRRDECRTIRGHSCASGDWEFLACVSASSCNNSEIERSTCGRNSETGERAWFADRCLPSGWRSVSGNKKCGSCCRPHHNGNNTDGDSVGTGCSFVNGSACALLEFQQSCPEMEALNEWRIRIIELVARIVSNEHNVSRAEATVSVTINTYPRTNDGTDTCAVRLQIFPPRDTSLTANDFIMALYSQLASSADGTLDASASNLKLSGIAAYSTYGSLDVKDIIIGDDDDDDDIWSGAHSTSTVTSVIIAGGIGVAAMTAASVF